MENLKLNDGTVLNDSSALESGGELFLYMRGISFADGFHAISEKGRTKKIVYTDNGGTQTEYAGYIRPTALRDEGNGLITAALRKEAR